MSAVTIRIVNGNTYYTKDYETVEEVKSAIERGEALSVFWFSIYGRRFQETLLASQEDICYLITEREIP